MKLPEIEQISVIQKTLDHLSWNLGKLGFYHLLISNNIEYMVSYHILRDFRKKPENQAATFSRNGDLSIPENIFEHWKEY